MNAQLQNNRPANPIASFNAFMQKHKSQLELALPKHLNADRMVRLSLTAFSQNPALQRCDPKTIFGSIIVASQLGLEIGVNGQGYLVPYKDKCTFVPGWKGLVDLANRGGRCTVWTGAVYEGDEFDYMLGDSPYCKHKPCGEFDEAKLTHVYAIGRVKDSEMPVIEVWPVKKVHAHFKKTVVPALQPNHYSKKHFEAYAKKVALLQVLKYMPQSIEMSNAVDVSYAAETGKGVVIDGDFVSVDNSPVEHQDDTQEQIVEAVTESHQQVSQPNEETYAPTFEQIKRGILTAKSPAHLDVIEEQAMDHANKEERKQLMMLVKAQSVKFTPKAEEPAAKKPEPQLEDAPPKQTTAEKKPTSTEVRKEFLDRIALMSNAKDLETVIPFINGNEVLTEAHKTYLVNAVTNKIEDINKSKVTAVDPNKSAQVKGGLMLMMDEAKTLPELEAVAPKVTENKAKLTPEDHQELLVKYSERKVVVAQGDIFEFVTEQTPVEKAISRIMKCQSQDEINQVWAEIESDPYLSASLTEDDKKAIESAADQREAEITG